MFFGFVGANITDGEPRIALIQEEDFSFSLYQTINGTTIQIAGFDNLMEAVDYFDSEVLGLEEEEIEPLEQSEEIEGNDLDDNGDDNGDDNDDDNGDDPQPEPILPPIDGSDEGGGGGGGILYQEWMVC